VPVILSDDFESPFDGEEIDWNSATIRLATGWYNTTEDDKNSFEKQNSLVNQTQESVVGDPERISAVKKRFNAQSVENKDAYVRSSIVDSDSFNYAVLAPTRQQEIVAADAIEVVVTDHMVRTASAIAKKQTVGGFTTDTKKTSPITDTLSPFYYRGMRGDTGERKTGFYNMKRRAESKHHYPGDRKPEEYANYAADKSCWFDYVGATGIPASICSPYRAILNRLIKIKALGLHNRWKRNGG